MTENTGVVLTIAFGLCYLEESKHLLSDFYDIDGFIDLLRTFSQFIYYFEKPCDIHRFL